MEGASQAVDLLGVALEDDEVRAQVSRPAFRGIADLHVRFLPYGELERNREAMARFGEGLKAIQAVARVIL